MPESQKALVAMEVTLSGISRASMSEHPQNAKVSIETTPTGSTGYNLSAGGPIASPQSELMLITPICPHTFNTRTVILSPNDVVEIEIADGRDGKAQEVEVNFDGNYKENLYSGDKVIVVFASISLPSI